MPLDQFGARLQRPAPRAGKIQTSIRIRIETWEWLAREAEKDLRTVSGYLDWLASQYKGEEER